MDRLRRVLPLLGINAIPIAGVFAGGWSGATALSLYWWENLIGSLLVALRLLVHRRLTRKRGYGRLHLSLTTGNGEGGSAREWKPGRRPKIARKGSFVGEFALAALAATAVHGLVLWLVVVKVLDRSPDGSALRLGVLGVAGFQLAAFLFDLKGLRHRSFAWVKEQAQATVNRVTLIHLVLIVGAWVSLRGGGTGFFGPFVVIKAMADVGNALARGGMNLDTPEAPAWLAATMNRLAPSRGDFGEYWRELKAEEGRLAAEDEQAQR